MKVLYHHRTMADGAEGIHIREIVRALRALGHEVLVVALAGDPTEPVAPGASRLAAFRRLIPAAGYELAEIGYNPLGYRRIMTAVRHFRPDVIYDRYSAYSTAAMNAARQARVPLLLEVNAPLAYERSVDDHLRLKFPSLARSFERSIFDAADRIFAVSTPLRRHLVDVVGIDARKIVVLPNGADPVVFAPSKGGEEVRRCHGIGDRFVVGFVGILRPWHGVDLLLKAFRELRLLCPDVHLLIVGDGPIQHQLESHADALGVQDAVTFAGRVTHGEVISHVAAMDVTVSPHATFYASPMKILEYMSMGKAVVAPAMENIRDIVDDGETGMLFEPGNASALAAGLSRLKRDEKLRQDLGRRARSRVVERFNWRFNALRVVDEAATLLSRDRSSTDSQGGVSRTPSP